MNTLTSIAQELPITKFIGLVAQFACAEMIWKTDTVGFEKPKEAEALEDIMTAQQVQVMQATNF